MLQQDGILAYTDRLAGGELAGVEGLAEHRRAGGSAEVGEQP